MSKRTKPVGWNHKRPLGRRLHPSVPRNRRQLNASIQRTADDELFQLHNAFKTESEYTVGIEIEQFIADAVTGQPVPMFDAIYRQLPPEIQQRTTNEFLACQIEYATGVHPDVESAGNELLTYQDIVNKAARDVGARLLWSATLPDWSFDPAMVYDCERSRINLSRFGKLAENLATCSMHVHVQVARADAIAVNDRLNCHVPRWVAMSANSPTMLDRPGVMASHRAAVWGNVFPILGFPRRFDGSWNRFYAELARLRDTGLVKSQKDAYFFCRPSRFGTLEIRCCDLPRDMTSVLGIAEDIHHTVINAVGDDSPLTPLAQLRKDFHNACLWGEKSLTAAHPNADRPQI